MSPFFDPLRVASNLVKMLDCPCPDSVTSLPGGRNNQVWKVVCGEKHFLLKRYFWSDEDPRDRIGHEWAFLSYLRSINCNVAPAPLVKAPADRCALLEFVEGAPVQDVTAKDVETATDFFLQMNEGRERGGLLPLVSEGCLSLESHLAVASARVERLAAIEPDDRNHSDALNFVKMTIRPLWSAVEKSIRSCPVLEFSRVLPMEERCLSPSDFGFHNALREMDGRLRFLDFEYAGWDDPAKTIIDFCNQPDRLLPVDLAGIFRNRVSQASPAPHSLNQRIALLEPLYQLKWACICLNGFLPGRGFSDPRPDRSPVAHLERARIMALRAEENLDWVPHSR